MKWWTRLAVVVRSQGIVVLHKCAMSAKICTKDVRATERGSLDL